MICENCGQNIATVHLTEIVNKKKKEAHLCNKCAEDKGIAIKPMISLNEVIGNILPGSQSDSKKDQPNLAACPECGITYNEFRSSGRFGCAHDYENFRDALLPFIEKIHANTRHVGKIPSQPGEVSSRAQQLAALRAQLQESVQDEDYEQAALLRDQIKNLEN